MLKGINRMVYKCNPWSDKDVEKHWDNVADIYVKENNMIKEVHDQRFLRAINLLNLNRNNKVLNITSRDCEADDYIHDRCPETEVQNAEISSGLIRVAHVLRPHVKQIKLDNYYSLPFQSDTFDKILSLETLEHVANPKMFLKELHRVAKYDARMVLSCPSSTSEIPYQIYTKIFGGHGEGPHRFMLSSEVKFLLRLSNWRLIHHEGTLLFPIGPKQLRDFGEKIIAFFQNTFISELGIRQFYVCKKY